MCQDTGTAIVMGKRGQNVLTDGGDEEALSRGIYDAYTRLNLRYSQMAPLTMWDEKNTGSNLPAQIELYATPTASRVQVPVHGQGRRLGQQVVPVPGDEGGPQPRGSMMRFLEEKLRSLGTAACPPYHLAIVVGGTSAEYALKTAKYASAHYLDALPTEGSPSGHGFRDMELEAEGARADPEVRHRRAVRRQVLLPRRARGPAAPARRVAARSRSPCPARPTARRRRRSPPRACSWSSWRRDPARFLPETTDEHLVRRRRPDRPEPADGRDPRRAVAATR